MPFIAVIAMEEKQLGVYTGVLLTQRELSQEELILIKNNPDIAGSIGATAKLFFTTQNEPLSHLKNYFIHNNFIKNDDCFYSLNLKDKKLSITKIEDSEYIGAIYKQNNNLFFISGSFLEKIHAQPENKKKLYNFMWHMCCDCKKV